MEYKKGNLYEMSDFVEGSAYIEGQRVYSLDASSCKSSKTSKNCGGSTGSRGSRGAVGSSAELSGLDKLVIKLE